MSLQTGSKIRWARNIVRTFEACYRSGKIYLPDGQTKAYWVERYKRASAILLAHALSKD